MEVLLILILVTTPISYGMTISLSFKMIKDIADGGYKLDINRLNEIFGGNNNKDKAENIAKLIFRFVPIVNLIIELDNLYQYAAASPYLIDQFRVMDCLIPFTKEEEEAYKLSPTGLNAVLITAGKSKYLNSVKRIENVCVRFIENGEINKVWFKVEDNKFTITKSEGAFSKLNSSEQQLKLIDKLVIYNKAVNDKVLNAEITKNIMFGRAIDLEELDIKLNGVKPKVEKPSVEKKVTPSTNRTYSNDNSENMDDTNNRGIGPRKRK